MSRQRDHRVGPSGKRLVTSLGNVRTMPTRWAINWLAQRAAPVILLAALATGCAAGETADPAGSTAPSSASPIPVNSSSSPPAPPSTSQTAAADVTVKVNIAEGKVTPNGAGVRVDRGQTVQVSATSDTDESLHIHGYDKTLAVTPGQPSAVTFLADQSGVFEIETHDSGKLVAKLIVSWR
jgi:hypothetical protein